MNIFASVNIQLTEMQCGECGIVFSVPESWRAEKQRTGNGWYCPNGHSRVYRESDTDKFKRLLDEERKRHANTLSRLNEAKASEQKVTKQLKRINKRVSAGVCPCCNRTFQQLARHMKSKHPEVIQGAKHG